MENIPARPKKNRIARTIKLIEVSSSEQGEVFPDKIEITLNEMIRIGQIADELGYKVYGVGGFVRDYYLQRATKDIDFTVVGDSIEFAKEIAKRFKTKVVLFERFRTAMVHLKDNNCEFVGTRKEVYSAESRKPVVTEGTLEDDLKRRDFTINCMAVALNSDNFGMVTDLFDGRSDLTKQVIKTPGDPFATFNEDPLRMMRAARFASQLAFSVDSFCIHAMRQMADRISIISQERITDEFLKILASPMPSRGLYILYETGILKNMFPEIADLAGVEVVSEGENKFGHKDIMIHSFQVLDNVSKESDDIWLRFAALVHDIGKLKTKRFIKHTGWSFHGHEEIGARMIEPIFRGMKLPMEKMEYVAKLVRLHQRPMALVDRGVTDSAVRRLAYHAGDALHDLFLLCRCDITTNNPKLSNKYLWNYNKVFEKVVDVQERDKLREFQSPVRGEEIMEICNIQPSIVVGRIKNAIEEAILDGFIPNEYEAAKEYFLKHKTEWIKDFTY